MTFPPFTTGDSGDAFTRSSLPSNSERRVVFAYPNIGVASQPSPSSSPFGSPLGSSQFAQDTAQRPPSGNSTCFPFPPQTSPLLFSSSPSFMPSNSAPNTLGYTSTSSFGTVFGPFGSSVPSSSPASVFPSFSSTTSAAPAFVSGSNEPGFSKSSFSFGCGADNTHSHHSFEKISENSVYGQKPAFGFIFSPSLQTNDSDSFYASPFRSDDEKPTLANQHRGSRVTPYVVTEMINERSTKMASICGMPVYGAKSHEELRWEDYQLRTEGRATDGGSTQPWFGMTKGSTSDKSGFFPSNVSNTQTWGSNWGVSQPFPLHINSGADSAPIDPFGKKPAKSFTFPPPSQANISGVNGAGSLNWKPNSSFPSPSNVQTPTCPSPFPFNAPNGPHTPPSWLPLQSTFSDHQPAGKVCPNCHSSLTSQYAFAYPFTQPDSTAAMPHPSENTSTFPSKQPSQSAQTESTDPAVESLAMADNIVAVKDPFGAQPSKQLSTQFGISSMPMPAIHTPLLIKTSSLHIPRHISQRRGTLRLSIQQQRSDQQKVPFFVHENDPEGIRVSLNHPAPRRDPKSAFMSSSEATAESSNGITFDLNSESTDPISKMLGEFDHITLEEEPTAPKLTRPGYCTEPSITELQAKESAEPGFCSRVSGFAIGRHGFGKIEFEGETDVTGLDLDSTVEFNAMEVVVYPDPTKKPPVGEGLNRAAVVTLVEVKKTREVYVEGEAVEKYVGRLKKAGEKQGAEFVSYDAVKGEWKFRVEHF